MPTYLQHRLNSRIAFSFIIDRAVSLNSVTQTQRRTIQTIIILKNDNNGSSIIIYYKFIYLVSYLLLFFMLKPRIDRQVGEYGT